MGRSTQVSAAPNPGLAEQKRVIMEELEGSISKASGAFAKSLYAGVATDTEIDSFLEASPLYNQSRWAVPQKPKKESELYQPFSTIAASVIENLGHCGTRRWVKDYHGARLQHQEDRPGMPDYSSPDLAILASGPSFETTPPISKRYTGTYSDIAACLEVKLDKVRGSVNDHVQQLGIYARQMFIQQPNRRFVRSLIITQENVRLFHFDRSGVQHTKLFNIHKNPRIFIRLLLGLSSLDEQVLGLDTSIQWTVTNGRKVRGTIRTLNSDNELATYDMVAIRPSFIRHSVRGRGTVCWIAVDPEAPDRPVLVKDSWRSAGRKPEFEFLELARGLQGVAQIISYENRGETKDFRGDIPDGNTFYNRIETRVTMESYGSSVSHFKTENQVITALRDAITGHKNLLELAIGILHRDISINNILLSAPGSKDGGILIDLDMAILVNRLMSELSTDCRTGTRMFQSLAVLSSYEPKAVPIPHDHLDDLESFFYVLYYIVHAYDEPGARRVDLPKPLHMWDLDDPYTSFMAKENVLLRELLNTTGIASFWGEACRQLLVDFHGYIREVVAEKQAIVALTDPESRRQGLAALLLKSDEHYKRILGFFDTAIQHLAAAAKDAELPASSHTTPTQRPIPTFASSPPPPMHSSPLAAFNERRGAKRSSGEDPEGSPSFKRSRTSASDVRPSSLSQSLEAA